MPAPNRLRLLLPLAIALAAAWAGDGETQRLLADIAKTHGMAARDRVQGWFKLIAENQAKTELEKIALVNTYFNRLQFVDDRTHWGADDYWATPIEMLETDGGDCEDFSVSKYFTLRALQIPEDRLRLAYVKSLRLNQAHMVLTYSQERGAMPLVLDNLDPQIKPASQRPDLQPVYSFNAQGLWLAKQRLGGTERLNQWQDLLKRMQDQHTPGMQ